MENLDLRTSLDLCFVMVLCKSQLDGPSADGQPTGSSCIKGPKDLQTDGPQTEHGEGACSDG